MIYRIRSATPQDVEDLVGFTLREAQDAEGVSLLDHLAWTAAADGALDLRLYAHEANARARRVYERCGFTPAPYILMRRRVTTAPVPARTPVP